MHIKISKSFGQFWLIVVMVILYQFFNCIHIYFCFFYVLFCLIFSVLLLLLQSFLFNLNQRKCFCNSFSLDLGISNFLLSFVCIFLDLLFYPSLFIFEFVFNRFCDLLQFVLNLSDILLCIWYLLFQSLCTRDFSLFHCVYFWNYFNDCLVSYTWNVIP